MARTILSPKRKQEVEREYLGKIIIFCEGPSEEQYINYFKNIINPKNKYTDIHVETQTANGDARTVLNFAEHFLSTEENNRKYMNYKKYLLFDCDAPKNIEDVINDMLESSKDYFLLLSNYRFENWLLMHFENLTEPIKKREFSARLSSHLNEEYKKANEGIIREIIHTGSVDHAIKNAYELEDKYKSEGKFFPTDIKSMNPYTTVHKLIEQFMAEIS